VQLTLFRLSDSIKTRVSRLRYLDLTERASPAPLVVLCDRRPKPPRQYWDQDTYIRATTHPRSCTFSCVCRTCLNILEVRTSKGRVPQGSNRNRITTSAASHSRYKDADQRRRSICSRHDSPDTASARALCCTPWEKEDLQVSHSVLYFLAYLGCI